jgi:arsenate reductase
VYKRQLVLCTGNSCRSQIAHGFLEHFTDARNTKIYSAGVETHGVNPKAISIMKEVGIDISNNVPKVLTPEAVQESDAVITMGCGDACPFYPGKRYEDWVLDDPAGQGIESVRVIRDDIKKRVEQLLSELLS